ncbi:hypothetical protein M3Y97_00866900 [Aphelenchoides bicaudatus]|nr:hypothetical protein M3Y97_00866900 [Aphelenchoides bicaudatus]
MSRSKTDQLIIKRILIIFLVVCILIIFLATICAHKWGVKRAGPSNVELELKEILKERQTMLKEAIFEQDQARRNSRYADPMRLDHEQI